MTGKCYCGTEPEKLVKEVEVERHVADRMATAMMAHGEGTVAAWCGPNEMRLDDTLNPDDIVPFTVPHKILILVAGREPYDLSQLVGRFPSEQVAWKLCYGVLGIEYKQYEAVTIEYHYYGSRQLLLSGDRVRVRNIVELLATNA